MNIINEKVYHTKFGCGTISEVEDDRIKVQFEEEIGIKLFLYPDVFVNFLRAENLEVENFVIEELHEKHEKLEKERKEKEEKEAEILKENESLKSTKKKATKLTKK
jgi:hypothetical protein